MNINMGLIGAQLQKSNQGIVQIKQPSTGAEQVIKSEVSPEEASGQSDKVSLSIEGLKKQASEVNNTESKEASSPADAVIARLKEQIEELNKKIDALRGDDSPEAKEQLKMLQDQVSTLNAALLNAISEKLKDK